MKFFDVYKNLLKTKFFKIKKIKKKKKKVKVD